MRTPPGFPKIVRSYQIPTNITATQIFARIYVEDGFTVLGARLTPVAAGVDFTTTDETYVISIEDNTTKISTDNTAITALNKTGPSACTVAAASRRIAAGHYVTVTLTLGGTTPIVPALSVVELEGYEG
jgi:hypothetical protein